MIMKLLLLPLLMISINGSDVEKAVMDNLNDNFPLVDAEYLCDFSRLNTAKIDRYDSVAVDGFGKDLPRGNVVVRFSFFKDGTRAQMTAGTVKVGIIKKVLTLRSPVKAGEKITEDMVAQQFMDIAPLNENVFGSFEQLGEVVAVRYIPPGRILTRSSVTKQPVVVPGDIVDIKYKKGPLSLTARGIVKKAGSLNSEIRVLNIDTKKLLRARVVDSTTVALSMGEEM